MIRIYKYFSTYIMQIIESTITLVPYVKILSNMYNYFTSDSQDFIQIICVIYNKPFSNLVLSLASDDLFSMAISFRGSLLNSITMQSTPVRELTF